MRLGLTLGCVGISEVSYLVVCLPLREGSSGGTKVCAGELSCFLCPITSRMMVAVEARAGPPKGHSSALTGSAHRRLILIRCLFWGWGYSLVSGVFTQHTQSPGFKTQYHINCMCPMPIIPALGRYRQENQKLRVILDLGCSAVWRPAGGT